MLCSVFCALPHLYRVDIERQCWRDILPRTQTLCFPLRAEASTTAEGKYLGAKASLGTRDSAASALEAACFHSL